MQKKCVLGIDIGTSGCKCILLCQEGKVVGSESQEYPIYAPNPTWSEQDPQDWWNATINCIKKLMRISNIEVCAISFSGQMHGMVALDENGNVVRNAILWNDQRTNEQCEKITKDVGGVEKLMESTNNQMLTGYTGGKILWMKQNEIENYNKTKVILNPKDFIRFKLTGEIATDVSDASGYGLFNVEKRKWAFDIIEKIKLKKSLFPKVVESTEQTGVVSEAAAKLTALCPNIPVYGGGGDAVISTTGMGLVAPGKVGVTLGTSGVVAMGLPKFTKNPGQSLQVFCNNKENTWHAMGVTLAAAGSNHWFRNTFGDFEIEKEKQNGKDSFIALNDIAEKTRAGAEGLIFLPYLTGERCPINDPKAKGAFIGITSTHNKGHFARAVLEGVAFSLKQVFDLIASTNASMECNEVILSGGGAVSPLWRQIVADVFEMPVHTVYGSAQGGAFGAALVAGAGCGLWPSLESAMLCAKPETETLPNANNFEIYTKQYSAYIKMHKALEFYTK